MMAGLISDLKHAVRLYLKTPWQSALAIVMLAAAMALVAAMVSLWSDLHLGSSPGLENDRGLVTLGARGQSIGGVLGAEVIAEFRDESRTLKLLSGAATIEGLHNIFLDGQRLQGRAEPVLPDYFQTLRPRLSLGRGLEARDYTNDGDRVLVISHKFWKDSLEQDPDVIGRELDMADQKWRVVGVAHPDFRGLGAVTPLFWIPYRRYFTDIQPGVPTETISYSPIWRVAARLSDGVKKAAAESEVQRFVSDYDFFPRVGQPGPERLLLTEGIVENPEAHAAAQRQVTLLLVAALLIATVAAINAGIFVLARAPIRRRELALRQALGAGRRRLTGQLLAEAAILVLPAVIAGGVLSIWLAALIRTLSFLEEAGFSGQGISWPALAFLAFLATVFTVIVSLAPIVRIRSGRIEEGKRLVSSRPSRFQLGAASIQISLSGLIGAIAIAFLLHLTLMNSRDLGYDPEGVLFVSLALELRPGQEFSPPNEDAAFAFRSSLRDRLNAIPGVQEVSFGSPLPGQRMFHRGTFEVNGQSIEARIVNAGPGMLEILGIELLRGREFEHDNEIGVILSREFANQAWGTVEVVDRFLTDAEGKEPDERWRIIGVSSDTRFDHPDYPIEPIIFASYSGMGAFMANVIVRGPVDPGLVEAAIEEVLKNHLDLVRVNQALRVKSLLNALMAPDRSRAVVTSAFGVVTLLLTGFGFFAMLRFMVESGTREVAIRMALGASPKHIRNHVLKQGFMIGLPGLAIGSLMAITVVSMLTDELISVDIAPLVVASLTTATLLVLMLLATAQPALAASCMKPSETLKEE